MSVRSQDLMEGGAQQPGRVLDIRPQRLCCTVVKEIPSFR
jgi:hypothetical protein